MIEIRIQAEKDNKATITVILRQDDRYSAQCSLTGSSSLHFTTTIAIDMLCQTLTNEILKLAPIYENAVEFGNHIYLEIIPFSFSGSEIPLGELESLVTSLQDNQLFVKQVMMKNLYINEFEDIGPGLGLAPAETNIGGLLNVINQAEKLNTFEQLSAMGLSFFVDASTSGDMSYAAPQTPNKK